jgi:hypothetical protein
MRQLKYILLAMLLTVVSSCDLSSPEEAKEIEIRNKLEEIELAFNLHHIEDIMMHYSWDYLHNGDDIGSVRLDWEIRLNDYQEMELTNIDIELNGEKATARFERKFKVNGEVEVNLSEPDDNGDMSYWEWGIDGWKIRGNGEFSLFIIK